MSDDDAWGRWWRLINDHLLLQWWAFICGCWRQSLCPFGGLIFDFADMGMCKKIMLSLSLSVKIGDSSFFHHADLSFSLHWTHPFMYCAEFCCCCSIIHDPLSLSVRVVERETEHPFNIGKGKEVGAVVTGKETVC